jgi:hypothetical protein
MLTLGGKVVKGMHTRRGLDGKSTSQGHSFGTQTLFLVFSLECYKYYYE